MDILNGSTQRIIHKEFIRDLDTIPPPAWDYFAGRPYDFSCDFLPEEPVFYHNTSRGCPYRCAEQEIVFLRIGVLGCEQAAKCS
jgi:radical SAM superfamily enzyme YgiQ (UPF0313 family)